MKPEKVLARTPGPPRPLVSVLIPCYNEAASIDAVLAALYGQSYPREQIEVIVADGGSQDGTRERVAAFAQAHPDLSLRLIENPRRSAPAGLNAALELAQGEYILRMDGHAVPHPDYVARCLEALAATSSEGVGGLVEIGPSQPGAVARAVAIAVAHPFGVGDARYRIGGAAGFVDTVPFGAYRREVFDRIGLFDERVAVNEDFDFNYRLRASGGKVYFDPAIRSRYLARGTLRALSKQYHRYGFQKATMLSYHPGSLRWRQLMAPSFLLSLLVLGLAAVWSQVARFLLIIEVGAYLVLAVGSALHAAIRGRQASLAWTMPLAFATIHLSWGAGFWIGWLNAAWKRIARAKGTAA